MRHAAGFAPGGGFSTFNDCWYCSPDDLGTRDVRRAWEQKRLDPTLAPYVRLVEAEVLDEDAD